MTQNQLRSESYKVQNEMCARIVLERPDLYPADSLLGIWARMVLEKVATPADTESAGPLFEAA